MNKLYFIILLLVFSCSYGRGNKETLNLYHKELEKNISSQEIIAKYGSENRQWYDSSGNKIISYNYAKPVHNLLSFSPIPLTKSSFDNYEVVLIFNKKDQLIEVKRFTDRIETLPITVCEPDLADCMLNYKVIERR